MTTTSIERSRANIFYLGMVCFVAALGGLLFGYDTAVIANAIGLLKKRFELGPALEGWAASCVLAGCMLGVSIAGIFSDRLGRRKTLMLSGALFLISAIGTATPTAFWMFVVFRIMAGMGVGVASMACPMYIAEITPPRIRGRMVSVYQFAIVSGIFVTYFVNYFIAGKRSDEWNTEMGWRWMFAAGAAPSVLYLLFLLFVPESPRWLVKQGRGGEAGGILAAIDGSESAAGELASIQQSLSQETSGERLFQRALWPVLAIGIALAVLQQITGINVFLYYAEKIFKQGGSEKQAALINTVVVGAVNMLFTIVAIWTIDRLGRKPLMIIGSIGMGLLLLLMGVALQFGSAGKWMLGLIVPYIAFFALSVGPVTWVLLSEIFPTRVRGRALSLATLCLWAADWVVTQTFPMLVPEARNEPGASTHPAILNGALPFYLYAFFCVVLVATVWRFVPETKNRTLEEIEHFWGRSSREER